MSIVRHAQLGLLALLLASPITVQAQSENSSTEAKGTGISILAIQPSVKDEVHYINANIKYDFGKQVLEALQKGVPLTVVLDIEIVRERGFPWPWDEEITTLQQRYQIAYHALSRQYMVRNLNIGTQQNLPSLPAALAVLGTVVDLPLIDNNLLQDGSFKARMRASLDTNPLPVPLRLVALVSPGWRLTSEWHEWPL